MKGFASLHAGLIARRETPRHPPPPPSVELLRALEEAEAHDAPEHQLDREGHQLTPSASLSADLITAGRQAYRAERQRLAQKTIGLLPRGEAFGRFQPRHGGAPAEVRDVQRPAAPVSPLHRLVPPPAARPGAEPVPARRPVPPRRRAVTLRLRPEQHARLLGVRRQLGCSFQVLVVRALTDYLDAFERDPAQATRPRTPSGGGPATPISSSELRAELAGAGRAQGLQGTPDVHFFTLPSGWYVAAWQQERGGDAATPSEVLGKILKAHGLADLIRAGDDEDGEGMLESVSLGDGGHRVALTIRLEADLHQRLQEARDKLGRTGQDILLDSINAYLES